MNTVGNQGNHSQWDGRTFAEGQHVKQILGVSGDPDETVELQGGQRGQGTEQPEEQPEAQPAAGSSACSRALLDSS